MSAASSGEAVDQLDVFVDGRLMVAQTLQGWYQAATQARDHLALAHSRKLGVSGRLELLLVERTQVGVAALASEGVRHGGGVAGLERRRVEQGRQQLACLVVTFALDRLVRGFEAELRRQLGIGEPCGVEQSGDGFFMTLAPP